MHLTSFHTHPTLQDWAEHSLTCNPNSGRGDHQPPVWVQPVPNPRRKIWTNEEMAAGPDQPMDPPPQFAYINDWWMDRTFVAPNGLSFTGSFLPAQFKEEIRVGLRNKQLNWEYLCQDNFLLLIIQATFPLDRLSDLITVMKSSSPKIAAFVHCESIIEHYWRTHCSIGSRDFDQEMYDALHRNGLLIPLTYAGQYCDDLRQFTHRNGGAPVLPAPPCSCWHCLKRPFAESIEEKLWEKLRGREADKGRYIMR